MFETDNMYRPIYGEVEEYFNQPVVYNGRNFILTLVKKGIEGEPIVIINNGWTIKDPFSGPIKPSYQNCWIFGLYYKLSDPRLLEPKRGRIAKLWKKNPEYFGCRGLQDSGKELERLVKDQMSWENVIIVGFTKSATMILNHVSWPGNVTIDAICPIFKGTYSVMPEVMEKHLHCFWHLISWIYSGHLADDDIAVGSEYLQNADYSGIEDSDVNIVVSTLDDFFSDTWRCNLGDVFFKVFSPIMEKTIEKEEGPQEFKSNGFLSFSTQCIKDKSIKVNHTICYASMPMTLNHPKVKAMIQRQIFEKQR